MSLFKGHFCFRCDKTISINLKKKKMKEFMLLIRTEGDHLTLLSPEQQQQHLEKVMNYMGGLMKSGKLKSAQPLEMEGVILSGTGGKLKDGPFNETKEVIAGYFLIQANDLTEAIQIARENPVFEDGTGARIEVRPIKVMEGINA
jgi:hypothetical protein